MEASATDLSADAQEAEGAHTSSVLHPFLFDLSACFTNALCSPEPCLVPCSDGLQVHEEAELLSMLGGAGAKILRQACALLATGSLVGGCQGRWRFGGFIFR